MIETELKLALDEAAFARLRRHPALTALRLRPRREETLVSIYCDTAGHDLAHAGIALRLRRIGRSWVQTVKRGRIAGGTGLFAHQEVERPAPGGRLVLDGPDPEGVYAAIAEAAGDAPLAPVFETRIRRISERLGLPRGEVELALDRGEIVAGEARAPVLEAEIELVSGAVGAVFDLARRLFPAGPLRLATANKAALGYQLARGEGPPPAIAPRRAGVLAYGPEATVETVARDAIRDCLAQIAENMAVVALSDAVEGPHQLRIGLRRLRTVFSVFGPNLGREALAGLVARARDLGRVVGALRDLDVLIAEVVAEAADYGLDAAAKDALIAALSARREGVRAEVRAALAGPEGAGFTLDLLEFVETRGWLAPADYGQTARLAAPIGELAPAILAQRHRKALKLGRRIETLEAEALHALRKELKKLRYAVETLDPIYPPKRVGPWLKALRALQDTFGSLNDATMAAELLGGADAPAAQDAAAQRAVGWVLGTLAVRVGDDRPRLDARWKAFAASAPFWE